MNTKTLETEVVVFPVRIRQKWQEVALARKISGDSPHLWSGYRGSVKGDEMFDRAAARALAEHASIHVERVHLHRFAIAEYYSVGNKRPFLMSYVFLCRHWNGKPNRTPHMGVPSWFLYEKIPTQEILPGTDILLKRVLNGEKIRIRFVLDEKRTRILHQESESINNL